MSAPNAAGDLFSKPLIYFVPDRLSSLDSWGSILKTPDILPSSCKSAAQRLYWGSSVLRNQELVWSLFGRLLGSVAKSESCGPLSV